MGRIGVLATVTIGRCFEAPGAEVSDPLPPATDLFALVHPTDAPAPGPGIVELDETGVEVARLPLPDGVTSPHGLAFDGASLWLSEYADPGSIFELDPVTGEVRSELPGWRTEGIALDGDGFWVDGEGLVRIDRAGLETDRRPGGPTVQDIAFDGTDVLFLTNGSPDTITRVGPDGVRHDLEHPATSGNEGYAMTLRAGEILVVDHITEEDGDLPYRTPVIRHLDPTTGELRSTSLLAVEGWVTAIVPVEP